MPKFSFDFYKEPVFGHIVTLSSYSVLYQPNNGIYTFKTNQEIIEQGIGKSLVEL